MEQPRQTEIASAPEGQLPENAKKVYVAPHLVRYGDVAKLTRTGSGTKVDMNTNMAMNV